MLWNYGKILSLIIISRIIKNIEWVLISAADYSYFLHKLLEVKVTFLSRSHPYHFFPDLILTERT